MQTRAPGPGVALFREAVCGGGGGGGARGATAARVSPAPQEALSQPRSRRPAGLASLPSSSNLAFTTGLPAFRPGCPRLSVRSVF